MVTGELRSAPSTWRAATFGWAPSRARTARGPRAGFAAAARVLGVPTRIRRRSGPPWPTRRLAPASAPETRVAGASSTPAAIRSLAGVRRTPATPRPADICARPCRGCATLFHAGTADDPATAPPAERRSQCARRAAVAAGADRDRAPLPRPDRAQPAALHRRARRARPARVRHLAGRAPPGWRAASIWNATTSRPTSLARQPPARRRGNPAPAHHQDPPHQPALLLRPDHANGTTPTRHHGP